jgi:DNA helicase-2/ATP-dependent DNA helicase PcrA
MTFIPTPEQRAIIAATPPLRVAAGAGTGKTATVTEAIAARVRDGRLAADEVLGITFTNKAAAELASRIRHLIGEEAPIGIEPDVSTYHGFAHGLLAEFGPLIGVERRIEIVTPTFAQQLLIEAVDEAGPYAHLPLHHRRGLIPDLARLSSLLGDHLATAADLLALPVVDDLTAARQEMAKVIAQFEAEKHRLGVVDYADLIRLAHRLVTTTPRVVEELRARYGFVVLDEYQDTSPAQRMLLQVAFGAGFPVLAVGDGDQTIYEWRGASLENFEGFPEHFARADGTHAPTLPLTLNRRSGATILAVANAIRSHVDDRERDALTPLDDATPDEVVTRWFRTAQQEADAVADLLIEAHADGTPWNEMAVLFRKNADIALVRDALEAAGVPSEVASTGGLLGIPEIVELHAWLRALDDPTDGVAVARLLSGSRYRLGLADLRVLHDHVATDDDTPISLIEALGDLDAIAGLRPGARDALADFHTRYHSFLVDAQGVSIVELVRRILDALDAWRDIESLPPARSLSTRLNLYRFLDLAESWSPLEGRPSLPGFLDHLALMADDHPEELDTARISGEDAVTLLTIHRAKGLEWDVVVLPALIDGTFPSRMRRSEDPFAHAQELPIELRLDTDAFPPLTDGMPEKERKHLLRVRHLAQEWRLGYVAATRARRLLHLSGAYWYGTPTPRKTPAKPSPILEVALGVPGVDDQGGPPDPGTRPESLRPPLRGEGPDPLSGDGGPAVAPRTALGTPRAMRDLATGLGVAEAYDRAVDEFQDMLFALPDPAPADPIPALPTTSVTGLVTYARCPKQFFWSEVDRLPRRPSAAARRGVEVHRRIELHNRGAVPLEDLDDVTYDSVDAADAPSGVDPFTAFLESPYAERTPLHTEVPFELHRADGTIRGRVDAVYDDEGWEIVDFKSGRPSDDPAMDLQLQAYALAATEGALPGTPGPDLSVTFVFLGDGFKSRSESVDPPWVGRAAASVDGTLRAIGAGEFAPRPSDHCRRCDFLRFCPEGTRHTEAG